MPPAHVKLATPQGTSKAPAASPATKPNAGRPGNGSAPAMAATPATMRAGSQPTGGAPAPGNAAAAKPPQATPAGAWGAGVPNGAAMTPGQPQPAVAAAPPPAGNGLGQRTGSIRGGVPGSGYGYGYGGGSFMQPNGGSMYGTGAGSYMQGPGGPAGGLDGNGSMYNMQDADGTMYGAGYGSTYGVGGAPGSMYAMTAPMGSMYGMGGPMGGSMYGMGGMPMGSMGGAGGGYGMSGYGGGFENKLYGGSMFGSTGSFYGAGGSLYANENGDQGASSRNGFGSMYGPGGGGGSMFGGFGSMYYVGGPHTSLGVVRKLSVPGFSYCFGSNLGSVAYNPSFRDDASAAPSRGSSARENSFRTSTSMKASEHEASAGKSDDGKKAHQRGATGVDKDGTTVPDKEAKADKTDAKARDGAGKPESIMKKQPSITEAPKSPTAARQQRAGDGAAGAAPPLSTDFKVHNVVIIEQADASGGAITKKGDACVVNGKSYAMDEVVEYKLDKKDAKVESRHLRDLVEHVLAGHNTAILVSAESKAAKAAKAAVESTVARLLEEMRKPARNSFAALSLTAYSLPTATTVCDLLVEDAKPKALRVGNSPLYGPTAMDLTSQEIPTSVDFAKSFEAAMQRGDKGAMRVFMLVLRQVRRAAGDAKEEVFISSVFIAVSGSGAKAFHDIVDKNPAAPGDVFRYALDGPTVCTHVVAVNQDSSDAKFLQDAEKIGAVQNTAARSGNVRRFIEFTETQLTAMQKRRDECSGAEKVQLESHLKRLSVVLEDAKTLLADPKNVVPHVYAADASDSRAVAEVSPAEQKSRAVPEAAAAAGPAASATPATKAKAAAKDAASPTGEAAAPAASSATPAATPADQKPRSTNVATLVIAEATETRAYSIAGTTVTAGGRPFAVDEVIARDAAKSTALETKTTARVLSAFLKGYNGAVIAADSAALAANGMESPAMGFVYTAVAGALANPGCKGVRVSIALVHQSGKACDLTATGAKAGMQPLEVSSSPLFGPIVHNAALHRVRAQEELQKLVDQAREQVKGHWSAANSAVHVTVVHCFAHGDDVLVSSLLVSFAAATCTVYDEVLQQQQPGHRMRDLFRYAFGGAATSAFVVSLGSADQVAEAAASLKTQHSASGVRNRSPRQGSIKSFVAYTKASLEKRRERLATLPADAPDRAAMAKLMAPMELMLGDHERVMADPANHFPRAYAADTAASKEAAGGDAKAASAAHEKPSREAANKSSSPKGEPAAADAAPDAKPDDSASSAFTEPRVVAFVARDVAEGEKQLSLGNKDYTVDEVVKRVKTATSTSTGPCVHVAELESRFAGVHNCSLISASSSAEGQSVEEPVWMYFQQCLNNALAGGKPGEEMRLDLNFAVVAADDLLVDLLSDEHRQAPRPLEIASSPVYGPRIQNARSVAAQNADELGRWMDKVHANVTAHLASIRNGEAMMIGTALLRRRTSDGDVLVASLTGTLTGASVKAYKEALEKAPVTRRTLLSSAYGGPSATVTLLNIGAEDETAQDMVTTAVAISKRQRNLVSRSGSVQAFVKYTESTLRREQARAATATDESRERHLQKVSRLQPVVNDHRKLLNDFTVPIPAYPATRVNSSRSPQASRDVGGAAQPHAANGTTPAAAAAVAARGAAMPTPSGARRSPQVAAAATAASPSATPAATPGVTRRTPQAATATPTEASPAAAAAESGKTTTPTPRQHMDEKAKTTPTPGTTPAGQKPAPAKNPIQSVVVVTPCRSTPSSTAAVVPVARADGTHVTAVIAGAERSVECDEVVSRLDQSAAVRSEKLALVPQQFVGGFNAALLCCDMAGSNAGPTACGKVAATVLETRPANSELYMSMAVVRQGECRDLLADGGSADSYAPMKVSNSPIFGPSVHNATMAPLRDAAQFDEAFRAGNAAAAKEDAVLVVSLVLKTVEKKDVVVSSLLMSLSTRPDVYAAVIDVAPKDERRLYQYAVHGSCYTVGVLGLPDKVNEESLAECLTVYTKIRTIENRPMRNGSVKRFMMYSINAIADVRGRAKRAADDHERKVYEQRAVSLERMVTDARALIESPEGRVPSTYA